MNSFRVLTKEETKEEMKKKDFDEFLTKSSRLKSSRLDLVFQSGELIRPNKVNAKHNG